MAVLRWGILGASNFAATQMAPAIHAAEGAELVALGTSNPEKAKRFSAFAPSIRVHKTYDDVLNDDDLDAIYIPLPNHMHVEWSLKALAADKHVLCEKPMTMQASEFDQLIAARDASGRLAAEAFMILHHPQFVRAKALVDEGVLGSIRHVEAVFSYFNDDVGNIRNQAGVGGGGLPDIGVYTFGAARYLTGEEPQSIPYAHIDFENGVDVFSHVAARFPSFTYSSVVSMRLAKRQEVVLHGQKGILRLTCPFNPTVHDQAEIVLETSANARVVERFPGVNHYVNQVEAFGRAAQNGTTYACPLEFSKGTQEMMDMAYAAARNGR